jgi:signal transduction histidine kinase
VPEPAPGNGFGLTAMRTRAEQAGGVLAVEAAPLAGVTVRLVLPAGAS